MNLSERLARYAATASGQVGAGRAAGEIAVYAAAAGVGLVMAGSANASIVYSRGLTYSAQIPYGRGSATQSSFNTAASRGDIDIDRDGRPDFNLSISFGANYKPAAGTNPASVHYTGRGAAIRAQYGQILGPANANPGTQLTLPGRRLAANDWIGLGGQSFSATSAGGNRQQAKQGTLASTAHTSTGFGFGSFRMSNTNGDVIASSAVGFLGIRTSSGYYGWIRLALRDLGDNNPFGDDKAIGPLPGNGYADRITMVEWAYERTGGPIQAGVPAPAPLALLAAGAAGLAAFRRRRTRPLADV